MCIEPVDLRRIYVIHQFHSYRGEVDLFVIAAKNPEDARKEASQSHGKEGSEIWLDSKMSNLHEVGKTEEYKCDTFILRSFAF